MLIDDRSSAVSLPELPLLGVLPGTGGLTRVTDKRHVRRDLADYFSTRSEGIGGQKAVAWRLVDEAVPRARWEETVAERAARAGRAGPPARPDAHGHRADPAGQDPHRRGDQLPERDGPAGPRPGRGRDHRPRPGPRTRRPASAGRARAGRRLLDPGHDPGARRPDPGPADQRAGAGHLGAAHRRATRQRVLAYDQLLLDARDDWLANEIVLYLKRTLQAARRDQPQPDRADRAGQLLRRVAARAGAGRGPLVQLAGVFEEVDPDADPATITVGPMNLGPLPMGNGLTRLQTRFLGDDAGPGRGREAGGRGAGRRGRRAARPGHLRPRRHRLGRGGPHRASRSGPASARTR